MYEEQQLQRTEGLVFTRHVIKRQGSTLEMSHLTDAALFLITPI